MMMNHKTNLDSISPSTASELKEALEECGWEPGMTDETYEAIIAAGFRSKNLLLAAIATEIAHDQQPLTLRGLMYQIVSAGHLPSTDKEHYTRTGRILSTLREEGIVPFSWIVDNVRSTNKPSSWAGLEDFVEVVKRSYRKDFWASQDSYCHVIVEKDAIAGVVSPVTREFDVALSPIRGYVSLSFVHEIASTWNLIQKPITCYYLGDFDASGFDLERDCREKLERYGDKPFTWKRLAINKWDFRKFKLIPLEAKKTDRRYAKFIQQHGSECAELDALPATELRQRIRVAINTHIDQDRWERLMETERIERESLSNIGKFMTNTHAKEDAK